MSRRHNQGVLKTSPLHPKVYEINTRVWLRRFKPSGHPVTLNDVPQQVWQDLSDKGMHFVWLMGIWKTHPETVRKYCFSEDLVKAYTHAMPDWQREDIIGSPYAIDDYIVNPDFGGEDSLNRLRKKLHRHGIRLMLDFVPNHFSALSNLIDQHPGIFLEGNQAIAREDPQTFYKPDKTDRIFAHGRDPYFPAWTDTIQVNYMCRDARDFMTKKLLHIAGMCDAVRCDMSMLVLNDIFRNTWGGVLSQMRTDLMENEFWPQAISTVKTHFPDFTFVAEAYWGKEWALQEMGFDFSYDKVLTDLIRKGKADEIRIHLADSASRQPHAVHFLENHDEERAMSALGKDKSFAGAVLTSTLPGMRLYYDGQFEGRFVRLPLQLGREPVEPVLKDVLSFYEHLLSIVKESVFMNGAWKLLEPEPQHADDRTYNNVLAWAWHHENNRRLVVSNFSDITSRCRVRLEVTHDVHQVEFCDLVQDKIFTIPKAEIESTGMRIELQPYQNYIFRF
jgi:hypothetical protein